MTILEPTIHSSSSTASPSDGVVGDPGYPPEDSLVYLSRLAAVFSDRAYDSLPDDHDLHSPCDEFMHELADKMRELAKAVRREAQAHGCAKVIHYSSGNLVVAPGKVWHPLEVQS